MIENPETVGEHLLNRRLVEGLAQHEVAQKLGVELWSVRAREAGRREPDVQSWPKILTFLGYDPNPPPTTMSEQIAAKRRQLGLTIRAAAELLGIDEETFRRWESSDWKPRFLGDKVKGFLALPTNPLSIQLSDP